MSERITPVPVSEYPPRPWVVGARPSLEDLEPYERWEQGAWDQAVEHLYQAFEFAVLRHGEDYAVEFLQGYLNELKDRLREGKPSPKTKRVLSSRLRRQVFERDAYRCVECGAWTDLTVDHIHPESAGGTDDLSNLQTMCRPCNSRKGALVR